VTLAEMMTHARLQLQNLSLKSVRNPQLQRAANEGQIMLARILKIGRAHV